jgi:hypothetical protein
MKHFAKVINGLVVEVHSATQEWIDAQQKIWYIDWIETSYNMLGGIYYDLETGQPHKNQKLAKTTAACQRKNYAGLGYQYDSERDAFIPPTPYPSWKLKEDTCLWEAPIPYPKDNKQYIWNEDEQEWTYTGYYYDKNGQLIKE